MDEQILVLISKIIIGLFVSITILTAIILFYKYKSKDADGSFGLSQIKNKIKAENLENQNRLKLEAKSDG